MKGQVVTYCSIVISGAGVTCALYYFSKWFSAPKQQVLCFAGLTNNGNTCYMNSILQSLASCPQFLQFLKSNAKRVKCSERQMCDVLLEVLVQLEEKGTQLYFNPYSVIRELKNKGWCISEEEHDSHEFMHAIISTVHDENHKFISHTLQPSLANITYKNELLKERACHVKFKHGIVANLSLLENMFYLNTNLQGRVGTKLKCSKCGHQNPIRYEAFHSLSIPFSNLVYKGKITLQDCLENFFSPENIEDVNCEHCTKDSSKQKGLGDFGDSTLKNARKRVQNMMYNLNVFDMTLKGAKVNRSGTNNTKSLKPVKIKNKFTKTLFLVKYPKTLCIHLQRLTWRQGFPVKLQNHIEFPLLLYSNDFSKHWHCQKDTSLCDVTHKNKITETSMTNYLKKLNLDKTKKGPSNSSLESFVSKIVSKNQKLLKSNGKQKSPIYKLCSVIVHLGHSLNSSGHFVCLRKVSNEGKECWIHISDTQVTECSLKQVLNSQAYMLFYEKISE